MPPKTITKGLSAMKKEEDNEVQLEDWVFNTYGYGFKHGIESREHNVIIRGHGYSDTGFDKYLNKQKSLGKQGTRPTMLPNEDERIVGQGGYYDYVWVGLMPISILEDEVKELPSKGKGKHVGTKMPGGHEIFPKGSYRVVLKMMEGEDDRLRYGVMVEKEVDGFCKAYRVNGNMGFFSQNLEI